MKARQAKKLLSSLLRSELSALVVPRGCAIAFKTDDTTQDMLRFVERVSEVLKTPVVIVPKNSDISVVTLL